MSKKPNSATARLKQDYLRLKRDPVPYITAEPLPTNILEWHYVVCGPEKSPYEGGYYHGKLVFPREFPFKPPSIYMITPNGRFKTNKKLCLSISDFHPDTWNPAWSVSTILTGLLSFMLEKSPTLGSIETTDYDKRQFAYQSLEFNLRNKTFSDLFPETVASMQADLAVRNATQAVNVENQNNSQITDQPSSFQSCITNLCVIIGFAAFAFTVKYVMKTTASEAE
ncbi:ubiquitin-conjugating enzyme E2 J2-like [Diorhabda carinulata]|uniref:ubiquitin-conjugating enzyme E2 J2-like n=1 Tax=Diorhabda sublineata TaxID=1163346 RepID=UPI0024E05835|nr:ubiquitin-conjugating enzyme E2 J2-like [Diorhabda sublineata]XP_057667612.1 ubiquitin-conjugating enzyme E2 J2-like [Diorhabda carinulata]